MKKLTLEIFTIVLGVLIALGFDDWRQGREEQRIASEHLSDITGELRSNLCTVERVSALRVPRKFEGLQTVLDFLNTPDADVEDPAALLNAFSQSALSLRPWLVDHQYQALQNSGNVRLLRRLVPDLALAGIYEGPEVLFSQDERMHGDYPVLVQELMPAQLQSGGSPLKTYAQDAVAPVLVDNDDLAQAVAAIRARRVELLASARNEAAVATARWYALSRVASDLREEVEELAPWDQETMPLDEQLEECRRPRPAPAALENPG